MGDDGTTPQPDLQALAMEHLGLEETEGVGLLLHDRDGRVAATNSAAEAILGLSSAQLRGRGAADPRWAVIDVGGLFVPTQRRPVVQALRTGATVLDYVAGVHRPSVDATAEHVWITGSCQPIFEPGSRRPSAAISAFRVLDGVEGQLLLLTESERHYRWIAQHANDMVAVLATDATHLWVSPSSRTMTGYTPDEMIGRTLYEFIHASDVAGVRAAVASMQAKGTDKLDIGFRLRCADGRILWVESVGQAVPATDSESSLIRLATRDVTPRVAAEIARDEALAELRDSERRYKWIAENASDMVAVLAPDGTHLWLSPSCLALTGYTPAELIGRTGWEFLHPDDVPAAGAALHAVNLGSMKVQKLLTRFRHKDGHFLWVESVGHAAFTGGDDVAQIRVSTRDVTARVAAEAERDAALANMRDSERRYRWIADNASDMVVVLGSDGTHLWVSPSSLALTGYTQEELVGHTMWEFLHPSDIAAAGTAVRVVITGNTNQQKLTCRLRHKDGHFLWVESVGHSALSDDGVVQIRLSMRDVTARVEAEAERDTAHAQLKLLVDHAPIGMCAVDDDGRIVQANQALCRLMGYTSEELVELNFTDLTHPDEAESMVGDLRDAATDVASGSGSEMRYLRADGETIWTERTITVVEDGVGGRPMYIVQLLDLTDTRAHVMLATLAMTDALTGLPNRVVLNDRLDHALTVARRTHTKVGVIFCDLDRFKLINDTMGHEAGDEVLRQVADRIRATIRESDTAVRLGGDEFVVLCENVLDGGPVRRLAGRLQAALDRPYGLSAGTGDVSVSIGIAVGDGPSAAAMLQRADECMYSAKRAARVDVADLDVARG